MGRGSEPGERRGGRAKGTPNLASAAKAAEVSASGLAPLDYMLGVMRDPNAPVERRDDMAKAAAPYVHPRFATLTARIEREIPVLSTEIPDEETWLAECGGSSVSE